MAGIIQIKGPLLAKLEICTPVLLSDCTHNYRTQPQVAGSQLLEIWLMFDASWNFKTIPQFFNTCSVNFKQKIGQVGNWGLEFKSQLRFQKGYASGLHILWGIQNLRILLELEPLTSYHTESVCSCEFKLIYDMLFSCVSYLILVSVFPVSQFLIFNFDIPR